MKELLPWTSIWIGDAMISRWVKSRVFPAIVGCPAIVRCSMRISVECPVFVLDAQVSPWKLDANFLRMPSSRPGCPAIALDAPCGFPLDAQLSPWMLDVDSVEYPSLALDAQLSPCMLDADFRRMPSSRPGYPALTLEARCRFPSIPSYRPGCPVIALEVGSSSI